MHITNSYIYSFLLIPNESKQTLKKKAIDLKPIELSVSPLNRMDRAFAHTLSELLIKDEKGYIFVSVMYITELDEMTDYT